MRALPVLAAIALFAATDGWQAAAGAPSPSPVPSVRPFDPRVDRMARDSTPELNIAGHPGLPDVHTQRCASGFAGQPWPGCPRR